MSIALFCQYSVNTLSLECEWSLSLSLVAVELLCQYSISGLSVCQSIAKYMHNEACSSAMRIRLLHARTILWEGVDARAVRSLTGDWPAVDPV